ncbi:MAG TPA: ComF family protein [Caulobacteraceae bacterium]|jgi:ComF family protein
MGLSAPAGNRRRRAGRALLDLVLPPRPLDGSGAAQSRGLSGEAWGLIRFLEAPVCDGCGAPFEHTEIASRCPECLSARRLVSRVRAACLYDEHSRELILRLKHADRTELAGLFAAWIGRAAAELVEQADAVAPVPLHPWRLFRRRYNQAAEVARPLARRARKPYLPDALVRARGGESQAGKSASARRRNVAAAFTVPPAKRRLVEGRRILLIDDVLTTGATVEACARALLRAGASEVDAAVIARVRERAAP